MKKILQKIKAISGNVFQWAKRVTEGPVCFLRKGRPGGMILSALLAAQFIYGSMLYICRSVMPVFVAFLMSFLLVIAGTELLALLLKILFGKVKRARAYHLMALFVLMLANFIGTQLNGAVAGILISVFVVTAVDVLGRCIWSIAVGKNYKQKFGYAALILSLGIVVLFGLFFHMDNFGEDQIQKYLALSEGNGEENAGFAAYMENGNGEIAVIDYGPDAASGIATTYTDISAFAENDGLSTMPSKLYFEKGLSEASIAGRIWYPMEGQDYPVVFIVHGNHDFDVPSYLGYDYLGEYLASNGYVVVSVDENVVNTLSDENDARAVLLLENMKAVLAENENQKSILYKKINSDMIAIAGHSRGGEMVATAYLFNALDAYPDDGNMKFDYHFNISSIIAIAPTVDQYMPAQHAVELCDVNYLLIHGSHDQDVSLVMGEKQYNNVHFSDADDTLYCKASVYIMGANHGQFNTRWGRYDGMAGTNGFLNTAHFLKAEEQQLIAKAYIRAFLDTTLLGDCDYSDLLKDNVNYTKVLPKTVYITNYMDSGFVRYCSFDEDADIAHGDAEDVVISCQGMETWKERTDVYGADTDKENHVLDCTWEADSEPRIEISIPATDMSAGDITFRIADMREDIADEITALDYAVELCDAKGNVIKAENPQLVYPSLAIQLYKQDVIFGSYEYKHQMQTVSLKMDMFPSVSAFDFTSVRKICIVFDGSRAGEIIMDDVGFAE
ncbi:MAG: hypothetical protein NC225_06690 [Clostridium sp.]|nr:hypothetical protein [Clostridium sp.]MCM1399157.1 hypothetical protein [Clostridium sp.]MCM1459549.1 hypothetical protein [Bacteroides sp.]